MATARAVATMAIFLLIALSASHMASSLRLGVCRASGYLPGRSGNCEKSNDPDCCEDGKMYPQYRCSPPVTASTKGVLTLNSFEKGKDGGGPSECDNAYHSDEEKVVALSTGWFSNMARCGHRIKSPRTATPCTPRWWTSATPCTAATTSTTSSRPATTTSSTPRRRSGTPWGSTRASAWWTSPGLRSESEVIVSALSVGT